MGSFNAQQHARMLNGLQRLNVAPSADMQAVLLQPETATRIVGSAERVSDAEHVNLIMA